jgi:hypothetical protein
MRTLAGNTEVNAGLSAEASIARRVSLRSTADSADASRWYIHSDGITWPKVHSSECFFFWNPLIVRL